MQSKTVSKNSEAKVQPSPAPCAPPEWLEEILEGIGITDGIDLVKWHQDQDGDFIVEIDYGEEEMTFLAGTDGQKHGVDYEGTIHDMTCPSQVQWWCSGELYMRLQKAKRRLVELANDESSDLRSVGVRKSEQREPQVRCDDWLGEPNKSGAPLAEKPAARSGVGGDSKQQPTN